MKFDLERDGNLVEAVFWFLVTLLMLFKTMKASGRLRKIFLVLTIAFFFFSLSDVIESRTGAWWTPIWLLLLKVSCVATCLFGFRAYYKLSPKERGLTK